MELCRFSVFFLFVRGIRISYSIRRNTGLNLLLYIIFIISENFIDAKLRNGTLNWNFFSKRTMDNCDELLSFLPIDSWFNLFFLLRTEFPFTPRFVVWNRFSGWAKQRRINVIVEEEQSTQIVSAERQRQRERERERLAIPSRLFPFAQVTRSNFLRIPPIPRNQQSRSYSGNFVKGRSRKRSPWLNNTGYNDDTGNAIKQLSSKFDNFSLILEQKSVEELDSMISRNISPPFSNFYF